MQPIKTYDHVNRNDHALSFSISRMEDIYAKHQGQNDEPHRHDFYTVLVVQKGKGTHYIDFHAYPLKGQQLYFIHPGQVHQLIEEEASIGYAITFSTEFLAHNNIPLSFIDNLNLFQDYGQAPPLEPGEAEMQQLLYYASELHRIHNATIPFQYDALGALLKLLLIHSNQVCALFDTNHSSNDHGNGLLQAYKGLLNLHYKTWHSVANYAAALHVTSDHLNRVVKSLTGKTAKEHIQSRIIVAAKRLIYFSQMSNKELAYELGFNEPANFSAFFKKCTGLSPSDFKKQALKA